MEKRKESLPLVSILIPAYNQTKYLKIALDSAINQTYKNIEIIICDDSTTKDVENLVSEYMKNNNIRYYNNGGPLGGNGKINVNKCFELANGEYISYLLHDDIYYPERIEKMVKVFSDDDSLSLVTSRRIFIDENDNEITNRIECVYSENTKISGYSTARRILFTIDNFIGELTTVMFRKKDLSNNENMITDYYKTKIKNLGDISLFLKLCALGDVFYISEPLSKFRVHSTQNTNNKYLLTWLPIDFFNMVLDSYEKKLFINNKNELFEILYNWRISYPSMINEILNSFKPQEQDEKEFEYFQNRVSIYKTIIGI